MKITAQQIKELRDKTQSPFGDCKKALENSNGDQEKALKFLIENGAQILESKKDRKTQAGLVSSYVHSDKKIGVLLELVCETDFVAKTADFQNLPASGHASRQENRSPSTIRNRLYSLFLLF